MAAKKKTAKKSTAKTSTAKRSSTSKHAGKTLPNTSTHPLHVYSGPAKVVFDKVRAICFSLPDTYEKISHGAPWFFAKKGFLAFAEDHHGDGRIAVWVRGAEGAAGMLVESDPTRFFIPPYVGPSGWIGVRLDRPKTDWAMVREIIVEGYRCAGGK